MIIPDFLKKGDRIAIVATARKVSPEEIKPSVDLFRSWGLEVIPTKLSTPPTISSPAMTLCAPPSRVRVPLSRK